MRGGTSRGPFFNRNHLPQDLDKPAKVLVAAVGAGHRLNIDGIGGGNAVTTKVVAVDYAVINDQLELRSAGSVRTARLLMLGELLVPAAAFEC